LFVASDTLRRPLHECFVRPAKLWPVRESLRRRTELHGGFLLGRHHVSADGYPVRRDLREYAQ